ncbi:MAG: 2-amino-4-hydroxy-6-hydroxymethyldihydropteridine diphosphokinase [Cyanobacteria bacterium J06632_3]
MSHLSDYLLSGLEVSALDGGVHHAAIALGSNLGNARGSSRQLVLDAMDVIDASMGIRVLARSHLYKTAPVGPPQPDYINACVTVETTLSPWALLQRLLAIENQFGRVRKERWGARSLDLDLLLFSNRIIHQPKLSVPHPRLHERPFVLIPLADIASQWQHPQLHKTVELLLADLAEQSPITGVDRLISCESRSL